MTLSVSIVINAHQNFNYTMYVDAMVGMCAPKRFRMKSKIIILRRATDGKWWMEMYFVIKVKT